MLCSLFGSGYFLVNFTVLSSESVFVFIGGKCGRCLSPLKTVYVLQSGDTSTHAWTSLVFWKDAKYGTYMGIIIWYHLRLVSLVRWRDVSLRKVVWQFCVLQTRDKAPRWDAHMMALSLDWWYLCCKSFCWILWHLFLFDALQVNSFRVGDSRPISLVKNLVKLSRVWAVFKMPPLIVMEAFSKSLLRIYRIRKGGTVFNAGFEKAYDHTEWVSLDSLIIESFGVQWL